MVQPSNEPQREARDRNQVTLRAGGQLWLVLLAGTIFFSDRQLLIGRLIFYPPEIVIYLWAIALCWPTRSLTWIGETIKKTPRVLVVATGLLLLGGIIGTFVSPIFPQSLGALKSWVITPIILALVLLTVRPSHQDLFKPMLLLGLGWAILGWADFSPSEPYWRMKAIYESANYFAMLIGPLLVWLYISARRHAGGRLIWLLVIMLALELALSRSIGGLIGVSGAIIIFEFFTQRRFVKATLIAGLIIVVLIGGLARQRLAPTNNSWQARLQIWNVAGEMIRRSPVTGVGLRGFEHDYNGVARAVIAKPIESSAAQPHNLLLSFWVNSGLVGLAGLIGLLWWVWRRRAVSNPATWAFLAIFIHGLIDTPYWRVDFALMFWLYIALICLDKGADAVST